MPSPSRRSLDSVFTAGPHAVPSRSVKRAFAISMSGTTMPTWYSGPRSAMDRSLRSFPRGPSLLARERAASAKAGLAEGALAEREDLGRTDGVHVHGTVAAAGV